MKVNFAVAKLNHERMYKIILFPKFKLFNVQCIHFLVVGVVVVVVVVVVIV